MHSTCKFAGNVTAFDTPDLGAGATRPTGINDRGEIVGMGFAGAGVSYGFLRDPAGEFTTIRIPLASTTDVVGINNAGEIAGSFRIGGSAGFFQGFVRKPDGTYRAIKANGIPCERVNKVGEGRPHIVDLI